MYFGIMHIYINPKDQGDSEGAIMAVSYKKTMETTHRPGFEEEGSRNDGTGEPLHNEQTYPW